MSYSGFDANRHNATAPGFSQAHDPFAGLSGRDDDDDALDFEEYDGLGDHLDETDDALNDDTFGADPGPVGKVGKDFDFFGRTAKVADAIEEEHLRYNRQPQQKPPQQGHSYAQAQNLQHYHQGAQQHAAQHYPQGAQYQAQHYPQVAHQPARSGYEKYKSAEPVPDLQVNQSIWGMSSKPTAPIHQQPSYQQPSYQQHAQQMPQPLAQPLAQPSAQQPARRQMMSLEEVEAAMRAPKKPAQPEPSVAELSAHQQAPMAHHPAPQLSGQPPQGQGHPMTILQRPQSIQGKPTPPVQEMATPPTRQTPVPIQPTQILQNPNRVSADVSHMQAPGHDRDPSQGDLPPMHGHPQMAGMSEQDKASLLDQETKRAKRNHKIWLLSKDNGFMTPQDKNFITRIQLQQLVAATGNPVDASADTSISEDFYYQVYSHIRAGQRQNPSQPLSTFAQTYLHQTGSRHGGMRRHGRPAENHFQRMEQQVQRAVEAAKNKPKNPQLIIEGTLGKISFSNAKTPKPLLNIKRNETESPRPNSGKPRMTNGIDRRTVLRNVEKVYSTVMKIEDHVRQIPPPLTASADEDMQLKHHEWAVTIEALNAQLWDVLKVHEPIGATVPHPFIAFLSCAKGKKAIPRIFPHLSLKERTTVLTMIIYHLDQLDVVQGGAAGSEALNASMRENIDLFISTVMPSLMQYFNDTGLDIVDGVLNLIATKLNVDLIAKTRIGVSMLTLILSRAVLLKQTGVGSPAEWDKW